MYALVAGCLANAAKTVPAHPIYNCYERKSSMKRKVVLLLCLVLVSASGLWAASFDCTKARSKVEKAICADPELSKLDEEMAASFQSTKATLSVTAFAEVRGNQLEWLRFASAYCSKTSNGVPKELTQC